MKSAKDLLDSLMGPSRNLSANARTGEDFMADNVCKHFLVGFCPVSLLGKKQEFVPQCTKMHSVALKGELEKHEKCEKFKKEYEVDFLRKLEQICSDADAKVAREKRKVRPQEVVVKLPEHLKIKVQVYEEAKKERLQEMEQKSQAGDVEGSQMAKRSADQAQKDIDGIKKSHTTEFPGEGVCEACGVKYLLGGVGVEGYERLRDGDLWEDDHYAAKAHAGFVQIREKLAEVRKARRERDTDTARSRSRGRDKGREEAPSAPKEGSGRSGNRDKDRQRDREREREKDKERDKDRGKDREKEKEKAREKDGMRERDRGDKDKDRDRDCERRDKDKDRDRDRRKDKEREKDCNRRRSRSR